MSSDPATAVPGPAIRVDGVGKFYPKPSPRSILRYLWPGPVRPRDSDFWALRGVSFEVAPGRVFGLIGRNGSGKSTLLQIIAGLMLPSEGRVTTAGKIAALLELGAGFNPEFTGRENVLLSGSIHGLGRDEMKARYDDIVRFADIGSHIDHPVKTYSSGMFARLAFAVSAHIEPRILLVDEILSVGDVGFQARCFRRIEDLRAGGTTILFVSHDVNSVQMLCDEALLLERGRVEVRGAPRQVVDAYVKLMADRAFTTDPRPADGGRPRARVVSAQLFDAEGRSATRLQSGETGRVRAEIEFGTDLREPVLSMQVKTISGVVVYDLATHFLGRRLPPAAAGDRWTVEFSFDVNLCPAPFRFGIGVADMRNGVPAAVAGLEGLAFEVLSGRPGFGLADLKGRIDILAPGKEPA